ncbi:hypothetical protein HQQ92_07795 [Shewanella sp. DC2-4]|uniref:hypothetical protein n=1 Tax=Shewanella sp. DC2-4 TaxID=2739431 RepID=UPI0015636FCC|nr:hypothetical protein [Shewanella sp. DC2-4]NRD31678.1 hypothetical protein [Shewanella sp. DC2-4]
MDFDLDKWIGEIREAIDSYTSLHDPIICGDAMTKYYQASKLIELSTLGFAFQEKEKSGKEPSKEELQAVADKFTKEFSEQAFNGLMVYRRQMIVISSTIFEALLNEYLKCHFVSNPQKMYNYVSTDGTINFKDVLEFECKEDLIYYYALIAAKRFTSKPWKIVFRDLEKILKLELVQKEVLLKMLTVRNEIIHEASKAPVNNDDVFDYFYAVENFARSIATIV